MALSGTNCHSIRQNWCHFKSPFSGQINTFRRILAPTGDRRAKHACGKRRGDVRIRCTGVVAISSKIGSQVEHGPHVNGVAHSLARVPAKSAVSKDSRIGAAARQNSAQPGERSAQNRRPNPQSCRTIPPTTQYTTSQTSKPTKLLILSILPNPTVVLATWIGYGMDFVLNIRRWSLLYKH